MKDPWRVVGFAFVSCAAWIACAVSAAAWAAGDRRTEVTRDLAYGAAEHQRLDVHRAPAASERPVVVFVHGGGWSRGDKMQVGSKPPWLVGAGYVFVSVNYRLLPEGRHPASVDDVAAAIGWVRDNIHEHGGDPEAIFLIGHSSGAQLAALVATDERYLGKRGLGLGSIAGVVALDTDAYDLERLVRSRPEARSIYFPVFGAHPVSWRDGSPIVHVAAGKGIAPFLLVVAGEQPSKLAQVRAFQQALVGAEVAVDVAVFAGETHGTISSDLGKDGHEPSLAVAKFLASAGD